MQPLSLCLSWKILLLSQPFPELCLALVLVVLDEDWPLQSPGAPLPANNMFVTGLNSAAAILAFVLIVIWAVQELWKQLILGASSSKQNHRTVLCGEHYREWLKDVYSPSTSSSSSFWGWGLEQPCGITIWAQLRWESLNILSWVWVVKTCWNLPASVGFQDSAFL